jgi:hypothetical protein
MPPPLAQPWRSLAATRGRPVITPCRLDFTLCTGSYPNGRIAEISYSRTSPARRSKRFARDAGVTVSIALQFGAGLETIRAARTRDHDGGPATLLRSDRRKSAWAPRRLGKTENLIRHSISVSNKAGSRRSRGNRLGELNADLLRFLRSFPPNHAATAGG